MLRGVIWHFFLEIGIKVKNFLELSYFKKYSKQNTNSELTLVFTQKVKGGLEVSEPKRKPRLYDPHKSMYYVRLEAKD